MRPALVTLLLSLAACAPPRAGTDVPAGQTRSAFAKDTMPEQRPWLDNNQSRPAGR